MEELLSLKWNNHRSTFIQILGTLREKQSYTDVTLACDGKFYSVHKLVLSTCSEYFSAMFDKTPCKNPVIVLKDIKSDDLDALLDYMYLGEVNVRQSDLASLIKAAECLRIKGLAVPDDEPPKKGPSTSRVGSSNAPERRADSPPAKRKRRDGSEDSRDDSRHSMAIAPQPPQAQSPPPSSSRPKTPPGGTQRHSPAPHPPRPSQSSPSEGGRAPSPSHPPTASPAERTTPQSRGGEGEQYDQPTPYVKVEMDDGGQGDPLGDSYDIPSDGYKEESDVGGDLSNDFPEFLQAAASGTLPGNSTSPSFSHPNFPGTSAFQPGEIPGWQGDGTIGLPPHLTFSTSENSSQNPGVGGASGLECGICGRVVQRRGDLERHILTHTGQKPFACPLCTYTCNRKSNLYRHVRSTHPDNPLAALHHLHLHQHHQHHLPSSASLASALSEGGRGRGGGGAAAAAAATAAGSEDPSG